MSLEITKCLGEVPLLLPLESRNYSDLPGLFVAVPRHCLEKPCDARGCALIPAQRSNITHTWSVRAQHGAHRGGFPCAAMASRTGATSQVVQHGRCPRSMMFTNQPLPSSPTITLTSSVFQVALFVALSGRLAERSWEPAPPIALCEDDMVWTAVLMSRAVILCLQPTESRRALLACGRHDLALKDL